MTDYNPYDFLSGDEAAKDKASQEAPVPNGKASSPDINDLTSHAPEGTMPRADSVAALAAREEHERRQSYGTAVEFDDDNPYAALEDDSANGHSSNGHANGYESYDYNGNGYQSEETGDLSLAAVTDMEDLSTVPELAPLADGGDPPGPPRDSERAILQPQEPVDPNAPHDVEQDIWSHLGELRLRMLHAIGAVMLAMCVTWNFVPQFQDWLLAPVKNSIKVVIIQIDPMSGFTTYLQLSMVAGLIISAPYVLLQTWLFLVPALTRNEKKYVSFLLPFSIILFFTGCALGYVTSPLFFKFFRAFTPSGVDAQWEFQKIVLLLGKMLLVFGVCFQVPVVTIFLNKIGLVSRNWLIEYWRHVVIVIFIVVSILTPTWDPVTLLVCAVPPCLLYALSIWLVKWL